MTVSCIRFLKSDVYKDCIRAEMSGAGAATSAVSEQNLVSQDTAAQNHVHANR